MKNENVLIEIPHKQKKNQSYVETPETLMGNISFHSVAEKDKKHVNPHEIFSQKWVLNKLIEMDCEKIEEFEKMLPEIQLLQQPKEELLSICLDILTNQSMNNKDKSIIEQFYEDSKGLIKPSLTSLGAWIETMKIESRSPPCEVAPPAGAWIETIFPADLSSKESRAPCGRVD